MLLNNGGAKSSDQGGTMLNNFLLKRVWLISLWIVCALFLHAANVPAANGPNESDDGMEVLTRGPIHEAFAEVSVDQRQPGVVVSRPVPEPINEIPPEFRPEGANVAWIPGYWSWDEEQNDFIWVSGIWRDIPPGRQWVAGYWTQVAGGSQYVSGFWRSNEQAETVYLPPPPQPLESSPSSPALSPSHVWINGSWVWYQNGYAWQGGYWLDPRPNMIWIPAHYVWTPRGYVFVRGYWDYHLERRGVLFAPRYYSRPIYRNHGYFYSPRIVLDIDAVFLSLFIRWDSRHYYFGDYHGAHYERRGFHPWYSKRATRYGYDPYYRSYRQHRLIKDRAWENNYHRQFQYRRDHKEARPPRIYRPQMNQNFEKSRRPADAIIGRRLDDVVVKRDQPVKFKRLPPDYKRVFSSQDGTSNKFQTERRTLETRPTGQEKSWKQKEKSWKPADSGKHEKIKMSPSPLNVNAGKPPFSVKPQEKYQENKRVRSQEEKVDRPRTTQQGRQHMEQQNKFQQPFQTKVREKQYPAQKGGDKEKPQSQWQAGQHHAK
jgi:hypothetical protein